MEFWEGTFLLGAAVATPSPKRILRIYEIQPAVLRTTSILSQGTHCSLEGNPQKGGDVLEIEHESHMPIQGDKTGCDCGPRASCGWGMARTIFIGAYHGDANAA